MSGSHSELPRLLTAAEEAAPVEAVDVVAASLLERFEAREVSFLIVDLTGKAVVRLSTATTLEGEQHPERVDLFGSVYEHVVRTQQVLDDETSQGWRVIAPVTNRGDAIGLLELLLPAKPDRDVLEAVNGAAHALAYIVIANGRFTDFYAWGKRSRPLSLAAEIQYQLLPRSLSCEAAEFTLSGNLEPSEDISGDTFDYTLDRDALHVSITDPMGHHVDASLLATILMGALRGVRRQGGNLLEQAESADQAITNNGPPGHATGQLVRVNLHTGQANIVNAGHPWPLRLRHGQVEEVVCEVDVPFGLPLPARRRRRLQNLDMRPGDRLIMLTDGMLERHAAKVSLPALIQDTRHLHPRETAIALTSAVLDAAGGQLADDATVMCLDWHGSQETRRQVGSGADIRQASPRRAQP